MEPVMSVAEVNAYLAEVFPETAGRFSCTELGAMRARVDLHAGPGDLRPGGTVSGPTIFTLADCGFYMALLGMIGKQALAVTTNASIDFMRKPAADTDLICETKLLKLGRVLAVGDAYIHSARDDAVVARASLTYSIPPK